MRYTSGDLCINWTDEELTLDGEFDSARGTLVDNSNPVNPVILWTFYGVTYPSFYTPARIAKEILDWAKGCIDWETLVSLVELDLTNPDGIRFIVKEAI